MPVTTKALLSQTTSHSLGAAEAASANDIAVPGDSYVELEACASVLLRKEVIQPQVLLQLPCYDFTPIIDHTVNGCLQEVSSPFSGATNFRDVTGGVYKIRERIHRVVLIRDY